MDQMNDPLYKQGFSLMKKILRKYYYDQQEQLPYLQNITLQDFKQFHDLFFQELNYEILFVGDVRNSTAIDLSLQILRILQAKPVDPSELPKDAILNNENLSWIYKGMNNNTNDVNNLVINYYQYGKYQLKEHSILFMIENQLNNEAFNYLRTEKELGYLALASFLSTELVDGFIIGVQGSAKVNVLIKLIMLLFMLLMVNKIYYHNKLIQDYQKILICIFDCLMYLLNILQSCSEMDFYIEQLLFKLDIYFKNIGDQEFQILKQAALSQLNEQDKQLEDMSNYFWDEIKIKRFDFKKKQKMKKMIDKGIHKSDLRNFFFGMLTNKLSLQLYSNQTQFNGEEIQMDLKDMFVKLQPKVTRNIQEFQQHKRYD